jgi:hypothetical protein
MLLTSWKDPLVRSVVLGLGSALVLASVGSWWLLDAGVREPPPPRQVPAGGAAPPSARASAAEASPRAEVLGLVGVAQRGQGERWVALSVGDALGPEDAVRTGPGARVDLRVGDEASRLSIPERSEVYVEEVTRAVHSLRLERGRIDVDYREREARVLRVRAQGGAVAETRAARFTLLREGDMVAVVTRAGAVDLSAEGVTLHVGAGEQALAFDGARPLGPEPIPVDVLLRVAARAPGSGTSCVSLEGAVRRGTQVWVEGQAAEVSREGAFVAEVPRARGRAQVKVVAREPSGLVRERLLSCQPEVRATAGQVESVKFRWNEAP